MAINHIIGEAKEIRARWQHLGAFFLFSLAIASAENLSPQTARAVLDRQFPQPSVSFLLLDARSQAVLAERWPGPDQPMPIGSLIKPFTAMAWAATGRAFPQVDCHGARDACWRPSGHGRMALQSAITQSCNAYFLALGRALTLPEANSTLAAYHLPRVDAAGKAAALAGLSPVWQVTPHALAAAYLKLEGDAARTHFQPLLEGMRGSAAAGTARALSAALPIPALAKTGTVASRRTPGPMTDGFTAVFFPAEDPRLFLLVRQHGVTGAESAALAGRMLRALEAGDK